MTAATPGQARQRAREASDLMRAAMAASDAHSAVGTDDWPAWEAAAKAAHEILAAAQDARPAPGDVELLRRAADALAEFGKIAITVEHWLDKPYKDDPRWSPWTRWVEHPAHEAHNLAMVIRKRLKAAPEPPPAPELAAAMAETRRYREQFEALRAELEALARIWREESEPYPAGDLAENARRSGFGYCAGELSKLLGQHPEPKPAPESRKLRADLDEATRELADTGLKSKKAVVRRLRERAGLEAL